MNIISIELTQLETFAVAMIVLFIGNQLSSRVYFLQKYNIPDPVVGGLAFSILTGFLYLQFDFTFSFDNQLKDTMMLAFFTTVGLGANAKLLAKGGTAVIRFCFIAVGFLILQDLVGILLAKSLSLNPIIGLLAGSITLSGGHGTGATYAPLFPEIEGAFEIAMACATFGLILGGVLGGPLAEKLISQHHLASDDRVRYPKQALKEHGMNEKEMVTPKPC